MGHYDSSRPGYCAGCGAAPGNLRADGSCPFCEPRKAAAKKGSDPKPEVKKCGTCRHLNIPLDRSGRRIPQKDRAYNCICLTGVKDLPVPDAVTIKVHRRYMEPGEGRKCPTWTSYREWAKTL